MDLLFTKGVKGKTDDQFNISLYSESNFKNTNLKFDVTGLSKIKKEYGVQLIGVKSELNKDIRFTVFNNDNIIDVEGSFYELDNKFVALMDNIEDTILGDEYFDCIYNMPFFIITEGLEAELFMSRDEFSKCISKLPSQLNNTMLNKVLYTNELIAMVKDIQNYTFTIYHNLIKAGEELSKIPESAFRQYNINPKESVYEYRVRSSQSNVISSLYMSIIIQLSSILDLISKLTCEIINMPKDYDKLIKFKSGSIYFSNIGRFSDILKKYPIQVSGGQKQRCAFARAVICNPKLIMADEPTGALDSNSSRILLEMMSDFKGEMGSTILMVTHDAFSASYAERILFLRDGRIFNEIFKGEKTRSVFYHEILDVLSLLGGEKPC